MSPTTTDILTVHRSAADGSLGKTLLRLATLAETLHRHVAGPDAMNADHTTVHGRTARPVAGHTPGSVQTELNR